MNILMTFILQRNIKVYWLFQHWMGRYTDDFLDLLDVLQFNLARFIPLTVTVIKEDSLNYTHLFLLVISLPHTLHSFPLLLLLAQPLGVCPFLVERGTTANWKTAHPASVPWCSLSLLLMPSFPTSLPGLPDTQQTSGYRRDFVPRKTFCLLEVLYS